MKKLVVMLLFFLLICPWGSLTGINIPASVTFIDDLAFSSSDNLTLSVEKGTYGEQFVEEHGLNYIYTK